MRVCVFGVLIFAFLKCLDGQKNGIKPEVSRLNFFDTDLLRYAAEERKGNVLVSPASIKSTLAMLLEGARGQTATEIRSALRLSPDKEEFREQLNLYLSLIQGNSTGAILQNANAVFPSDALKLNKQYEMILQKVYMTEVARMNFIDPVSASATINQWVNNRTRGLIPSILAPAQISPSTNIILTNVLYFKSAWKHTFDPLSTRGGCFYNRGDCTRVAMMELSAELNYAYVDNLRAHAVELPYQGERYSMILLVPQEREGLTAVVRDLPYMSLPQIAELFEPADVTLLLPRFTVDYCEDMVAPLRSMHISSLFSPKANLSGMFESESPQVDNIYHKVYIAVDEAGTVAAAASAAMVIPLIQSGVQLRVDRPFVFFVRDNEQGLVLFEGKIEEPTAFVEQSVIVNGRNAQKNSDRSIKKNFRSGK